LHKKDGTAAKFKLRCLYEKQDKGVFEGTFQPHALKGHDSHFFVIEVLEDEKDDHDAEFMQKREGEEEVFTIENYFGLRGKLGEMVEAAQNGGDVDVAETDAEEQVFW